MLKTLSSQDSTKFDGLTVKEVAYLLNVAPKTVYGWCSEGKIVYYKIMGSIRIKKQDVDAVREDIF